MIVGQTYIIKWDDDVQEYTVKFVKIDRGFFVFIDEDGDQIIARPGAITVRKVDSF